MATDNFERAAETPLAAPWVKTTGSQNINLVVATDGFIRAALDGDTFYTYSGAAVTADQYSQIVLQAAGGGNDYGPACRVMSSAITGYFAEAATGAEGFYKHITGSASLISAVTTTISVGDTSRLETQGSTLRYLKNGAGVTGSPITDTSIVAANAGVGVFIFTSGVDLDDWAGGDLAPPVTGYPVAWYGAAG